MSERRLTGKVAFVTGAARGQGRAHAVRLAEEGADIVASDLEPPTGDGELAADLRATIELVRDTGRRGVAGAADVRDPAQLQEVVDAGVDEFGRLDVVVPNAGVVSSAPTLEETQESWQRALDVNLTGVWHTCRATLPHLVAGERGGAIVVIGSTMAVKGAPRLSSYTASKHGVAGLVKTLALEFAPQMVRVNLVHPTTVDSPMMEALAPEGLAREQLAARYQAINALPVGWVDPRDVSAAVAFLASDDARYVTGAGLAVDAGALLVSGSSR